MTEIISCLWTKMLILNEKSNILGYCLGVDAFEKSAVYKFM